MPDPNSQFIDVGGVTTHLLTGGSGPALIFLHGTAPSGVWLPVHQRLAEHFTVYTPDHPGFGRIPRPDWLDEMQDMVLHYDELFRALGLDRPYLVGFSLGGWIAAEFAVTYPDRVGALALLNAAGLHVEGALIPDLPTLSGEALAQTVFHDANAARAYFALGSDPESRLRYHRAMTTLALLAWNPWFDPRLERRLRRIAAPTLLLWARHDRLVPPVYGEAYRAAIPGARLELIEECGHMAPIERPAEVAAAITRFLLP